MLPAGYDPLKGAPGEGLPAAGAVVVKELTSAVPLIFEAPSEMICPVNTWEPAVVVAINRAVYLPLNAEAEIGVDSVC